MDQFCGYAVAAMLLVNFIARFDVVHSVFKHDDDYLSFADTIIANFIFIVGFSFRLSMLRRLKTMTWLQTCPGYLHRSIVLVVISVMIFGIGGEFQSWSRFNQMPEELGGQKRSTEEIERALTLQQEKLAKEKQKQKRLLELERMPEEERAATSQSDLQRLIAENEIDTDDAKNSTPAEQSAQSYAEFRRTFAANWWVWLAGFRTEFPRVFRNQLRMRPVSRAASNLYSSLMSASKCKFESNFSRF